MILLIDNYDSFTYNLYQYLCELGADVNVVRNDLPCVVQGHTCYRTAVRLARTDAGQEQQVADLSCVRVSADGPGRIIGRNYFVIGHVPYSQPFSGISFLASYLDN